MKYVNHQYTKRVLMSTEELEMICKLLSDSAHSLAKEFVEVISESQKDGYTTIYAREEFGTFERGR